MNLPPLQFLHTELSLSSAKLNQYRRLTTPEILDSLKPGRPGALKARPDGMVMDGHHRLKILQERGIDIDALPRETLAKDNV